MKKCENGKYLARKKTRVKIEKKQTLRIIRSTLIRYMYTVRGTKRQRNKKANSNKVKRKFEKRGKIAFIV